ncbi:MAG: hypothetical protein CMI96_04145 [Pelagibacteraceae bacterium]|nr:hypothetical protein [Pelagibacteraceae bacterium]|tara:strand:+ start:12718 stop:14463 length:1746 start_codon:yes stop_codon:yes gene_type:complete
MINILKSYFKLFNYNQKRNFFLVFFILLLSIFFELLSFALLLPLISNMFSLEYTENLYFFKFLDNLVDYIFSMLNFLFNYQLSSISNAKLFLLLIIMVVVFFIKAAFLTFSVYVQARYTWNLQLYFSSKLFNSYLHKTYLFHKNTNSSILIRNVTSEINNFSKCIVSILNIFVDFILLAFLFLLIFLNSSLYNIFSILFIGIIIIIFYNLFKKYIEKLSLIRINNDKLRLQSLYESFSNIKNILLDANQKFSLKFFFQYSKNLSNTMASIQFVKSIPKHWIEFLAVFFLFIFILISFKFVNNNDDAILIISLVILVFLRSIPIFLKLLSNFQSIQFLKPSIDVINNDLSRYKIQEKNKNKFSFKNSLIFKNVNFYYNEDKNILKNFNYTFLSKKKYGIYGMSGSGKSTLVDLITGLILPKSGSICADDKSLEKIINSWQNSIGYISNTNFLPDTSILNNITYGIEENDIDIKKANNLLKLVNMYDFCIKLPNGINTFVGEGGAKLSSGQKQRLSIARVLYNDPEILILDEATNSLDKKNEKLIFDIVYNIKNLKLLIIVSHDINNLNKCDYLINIEDYTNN